MQVKVPKYRKKFWDMNFFEANEIDFLNSTLWLKLAQRVTLKICFLCTVIYMVRYCMVVLMLNYSQTKGAFL